MEELENIAEAMKVGEELSIEQVNDYVGELWDSICTVEQYTGHYNIMAMLKSYSEYKLIKLQQRYLDNTLMDGMRYKSV